MSLARKCNVIILIITINDIILSTNWWAWLDYRAREGFTTTASRSRHCSGSSGCAGGRQSGSCGGGRERRSSHRRVSWSHVWSCRDAPCWDPSIPQAAPGTLAPSSEQDTVWPTGRKISTSSYLVLDGVRGLDVFLEVTVVIESHPTLVTHYIFGLQVNFVNVLT